MKYEGLRFCDSLWDRDHYHHESSCKLKYKSIFKNFDPQEINKEEISDEFISEFGYETFSLVMTALAACDHWTENIDGGCEYYFDNKSLSNIEFIRLANTAHNLFIIGHRHDFPEAKYITPAKIIDPSDWPNYISNVAFGYAEKIEHEYRPSQLIAICVLLLIDYVLSSIKENGFNKKSANDLLMAYRFFMEKETNNAVIFQSKWEEFFKKDSAMRSAKLRHANDPKQAEKNFVLDCWKSWETNPQQYKSKAKFARAMLEKCEKLESQKVIEDWCRAWDVEFKNGTLLAQ